MHSAPYTRTDIERLYLIKNEGRRGRCNLETSHVIAIKRLNTYLKLNRDDKYINMVQRQLTNKNREGSSKDEVESKN